MTNDSNLHIFGIRHHGPGSARSVRQALETVQPALILVEGPPDADHLLPLLTHPEMEPPVAILIYVPAEPHRAVYYPFAKYSPEWQAIHYGLTQGIPVRFMDLPQCHRLAIEETPASSEETNQERLIPEIRQDPLRLLAEAAGYPDGERWWEQMVEHRLDSRDLFTGILEAMSALRQEVEAQSPDFQDLEECRREAYMRQTIRAAQQEGFENIAVVCGAWHGPALAQLQPAANDAEILANLPNINVEATWVPWTYGRLAMSTGYGAGVESPGWYDHLWTSPDRVAIRWMTKVARLLREQDLDASSASVIEAVRLAEALTALRDRPLPGLSELNEATRSVLCFGDDTPMQLIHRQLIVGERLGEVPAATPMVPLQEDLKRLQKRLRLPPQAEAKDYVLDLRKETDLERSQLLHRLRLLTIPWGEVQTARGKGTFKEGWRLLWQPEFAVSLVAAGVWGNTIEAAASAYSRHAADQADTLSALTQLIDHVLLAQLPDAIAHIMARLQAEAAVATDVAHLMEALPPLANVLRYGTVRKTDTETIAQVIDGLVARICIGLPAACASLNEEAATAMDHRLIRVHEALQLLQNEEYLASWYQVLQQLADRDGLHGILAGHCCRLLLDAGRFDISEASRRMGLALSAANEPVAAAAWIEGFVKGSALLLLHDDKLWQVLDHWVMQLPADTFTAVLPLLRRSFAQFSAPERRQMGERVRQGSRQTPLGVAPASGSGEVDRDRADAILPVIAQLLGIAHG
jgi:hypothetical protein